MAAANDLSRLRVGWWAGAEALDPVAALRGSLLRTEMAARCPGLRPVLVQGTPANWSGPGFTGEPAALHLGTEQPAGQPPGLDLLVVSGTPEPAGEKTSQALGEAGTLAVAVAPDPGWGLEPGLSIGPPFAVPEPCLLAARHLPRPVLAARGAYLRVVEGLPRRYVLVEGSLLDGDGDGDGSEPPEGPLGEELGRALERLAEAAGGDRPPEVVRFFPGMAGAESQATGAVEAAEEVLRARRAEAEEARYQAEDWRGWPGRPPLALPVASPVDLAAAVAAAEAVVAHSGALMALAWALGTPHVALAAEGSPASQFAAWTGDASALGTGLSELVAVIDNVFARRGRPPGLKRLEATVDQSLDEAAARLGERAAEVAGDGRDRQAGPSLAERATELEAVNGALRQRLAAERLHFGERAALLEKAAETTVESAIKAVHGQDVIIRRRLEETEREMHRLQEETALQQAELKAIYGTRTMRALAPAREWYERLRKAAR
ncbi:MAG: hypothetical protein ACRDZX_11365 [Acidimicrobiales bacterium]